MPGVSLLWLTLKISTKFLEEEGEKKTLLKKFKIPKPIPQNYLTKIAVSLI